jgi:aminoglycoside phosphotransferase (APT) family kinase protein
MSRFGEAVAVRPGEDLNWTRLQAYLADELGPIDEMRVQQFPNGSANLTYLLHLDGRPLVFRRPPFGELAPGAHDMGREFRVLSRLWQAYDRAPRALLFCADPGIVGSPFLVSEYRVGQMVWSNLPDAWSAISDAGRLLGLATVDALADLSVVDPASCGLSDLGRPDGFLRRQVDGWTDPSRVTAVFDWDMATLGDPLVDLGILLNYWPDPSDRPDDHALSYAGLELLGLPTRAEIVQRYAARTGLQVDGIGWYEAFAAWKTATVREQLHARYLRGESTDPRMASLHENVVMLACRSLRILRELG